MGVAPSVIDLTRNRLGDLSPAERKVARVLLTAPPTAGLETVARLAARAKVSGPTVIRFVTRLGFRSYTDFQDALRGDLDVRMASPTRRYSDHQPQSGTYELLDQFAHTFSGGVLETLQSVPPHEFIAAVNLLKDSSRRVLVFGGRFSEMLARYLVAHLVELRPGARLLEATAGERTSAILDARRRDVAVVFDYRRYQSDTVDLARRLHDRGAKIVLFTDPWMSPAADIADAVLTASVDAPSPFDSLVPATALVEALVAGLVAFLGQGGQSRVEQFGALADSMLIGWDGLGDTGPAPGSSAAPTRSGASDGNGTRPPGR